MVKVIMLVQTLRLNPRVKEKSSMYRKLVKNLHQVNMPISVPVMSPPLPHPHQRGGGTYWFHLSLKLQRGKGDFWVKVTTVLFCDLFACFIAKFA